ncbi:MAG TPA: c-type cytochrome [Bryobacteraceae bacterium]|jgi:cytochrome c|nr:c-type cytochrome [Bryobacteraceae bacterium]
MKRLCLVFVLILTSAVLLARADSSSRGQQIFERQCSKCHALDADKEGPRLRGVYGRAAASVASFQYSDALKKSHITWSDDTLDKWLTDPSGFVPDTYMAFHLSNKRDRQAVIDYLRGLSGK